MKLEERLGELLLVGFEGKEMDTALAAHICDLRPAGLIFFKRNIVGPKQLARLSREIQTVAVEELGRVLLLAVDQEGGTVSRMPPPFTQLPDASALGNRGSDLVGHYAGLTANEMLQVGLNMNLAPVLDVHPTAPTGLMCKRSFGSDPTLVAQCGRAAVAATQGQMVMATAKHFPGLGSAEKDPHHDLPVISAGREGIYRNDLPPFRTAIQAGVASVMTSHCLYPALDPQLPGTFSPAILRGLLRDQLGFTGVAMTDDLEMGAVVSRFSPEDAAIAALNAGADLLLVCNEMEMMHRTATAVRLGLLRGLLESQSLSLSLARVERLRNKYLHPLVLADAASVAAHFSE